MTANKMYLPNKALIYTQIIENEGGIENRTCQVAIDEHNREWRVIERPRSIDPRLGVSARRVQT
jgi:hypothetical protein